MKVFCSAILVDDSPNANQTFCSVAFSGVTSVVAIGENAALNSAKYGRNTGSISTPKTKTTAGHFQMPSLISRGSPVLPPTTE